METEIKKSYDPFKMWGSWVGLGIGFVGTLIYVTGSSSIIRDIAMGSSVAINPLIYLVGWPIIQVVLTTPIVTFLYGWGIHSIFRKLNKTGRIILSAIIAILVGLFFVLGYINTDSKQGKADQLSYVITEIHDAEVGKDMQRNIYHMRAIASEEDISVELRLKALDVLMSKVSTMTADDKKILGEQLTMLSGQLNKSTQLSQGDLQRMIKEITTLQASLEAK